jgi:DNA-directed RNA polymerase subunit F
MLMEVKSERFVTSYEARKILKKREKEGELNYEQKNAFDYLNKFCKVPEKDVEALVQDLGKIEKLHERHIVAIVETMPADQEDIRLLFANERAVLSDDDKEQILKAVKKHGK